MADANQPKIDGPAARKTRVGAGSIVWFAYPLGLSGDMLRDRRGVGRRFKTEEAALEAAELDAFLRAS